MAARDTVRTILTGAGLSEVVTYALVEPARAALVRWPGDAGPPPAGEDPARGVPITVTNPLSASHSVLRQDLVGSLLDIVDANQRRGRDDIAIFEVGKGYGRLPSGPTEWWRLAFALTGAAEPAAWNRPARGWDFDDAKGLVELLAGELGMPAVTYEPATGGYPFHPGRAAIARAGDRLIGWVGEAHPELSAALDLRAGRVIVAELAVAGLSGGQLPVVRSRPLSRHQAVERDLAIVVPEARPAATVEAAIRAAAGEPAHRPAAVRHLPGGTARERREEPRLPAPVPGRPDPRRGRGGGHDRRRHRGAAHGGRPPPRLTRSLPVGAASGARPARGPRPPLSPGWDLSVDCGEPMACYAWPAVPPATPVAGRFGTARTRRP